MSGRKPRGLRQDEKELWVKYTTGVSPNLDASERPAPKAKPKQPEPKAPIPAFRMGERVRDMNSVAVRKAKGPMDAPPRMDQKTFGRMKKGQLAPEARIDLHGMTVADAHGALIDFILKAHAKGLRLVLVITGKGNASDVGLMPVERGVLRRQVPEWLRLPPLTFAVLDVTPAHRKHGGDGAFYVYLKRRR